jgi:aminopeptidase N
VVVNMDRTAAGVSFWQVWYDVASETVQYKEITIPLKSMQAFADEAANALNLYAAVSGVDYPFSKLDLVNDPQGGFYGQAPSSIVYLGQAGFMSKGTLGTLEGMGGSDLPKFAKSLVAHETAHQWWGSLIGNANYRNYWWVESLAEYFAALFVENVYGKKDYAEHVKDWRLQILDTDMTVGVQDATTMWGGEDFSAYQTALYNKGPYVFHVMRTIWGDEKFFKFIQATAQALQRKEVVTRDIQKIAEDTFGGTMEWFFDQWIRQPGIPEFKFTHTVRPTEDGKYVVEGQVEQRLLFGRKKDVLEGQYVRTVVPITMKGRDGTEFQYKLLVDGPKTPFKFKVADEPKEVVFNKYGEVLAYDVISG